MLHPEARRPRFTFIFGTAIFVVQNAKSHELCSVAIDNFMALAVVKPVVLLCRLVSSAQSPLLC